MQHAKEKISILLFVCLIFISGCAGEQITERYNKTELSINSSEITKAEFAKMFCEKYDLAVISDAPTYFEDLKESKSEYADYISHMGYSFPHCEWTGKQWRANYEESLSRDMVLRSYVIYHKIPLLDAAKAKQFVLAAIPSYDKLAYLDDSFMYIATLLEHGLDKKWIVKNDLLTYPEAEILLSALDEIDVAHKTNDPSYPFIISNYPAQYGQEYYQDGPIINYINIKNYLNDDYYLHQYAGLKSETILDTQHVGYGIGAWASAITKQANTKIVGQFITAEGIGDGANSQIVGQEIDIKNHLETDSANLSQIGMQIVTIGEGDSTAAVEIISDWSSQWRHGILIDEGAMSEDGTIIAVSQTQPMKNGIDLGNSTFSDAAIRIKNDEIIKFEPAHYGEENAAFMKLSEDGHFLIYAGSNGFAVKSNDGMKNLFRVDAKGNVYLDEGNVVLSSPNGSNYALQVDDNGNLSTVLIN